MPHLIVKNVDVWKCQNKQFYYILLMMVHWRKIHIFKYLSCLQKIFANYTLLKLENFVESNMP